VNDDFVSLICVIEMAQAKSMYGQDDHRLVPSAFT
jgi:hypothetical protein